MALQFVDYSLELKTQFQEHIKLQAFKLFISLIYEALLYIIFKVYFIIEFIFSLIFFLIMVKKYVYNFSGINYHFYKLNNIKYLTKKNLQKVELDMCG